LDKLDKLDGFGELDEWVIFDELGDLDGLVKLGE